MTGNAGAPEASGLDLFNVGAIAGEVLDLKPRSDLYEDEALLSIQSRALAYLRAGVAVHLRGPAGTGKTTLALQIAAKLDRPAVLVTGDGWFTAQDLVGGQAGVRVRHVRDRFIHTVQKTETETTALWEDSVLTHAVSRGYTLVYDEFTRSPPAANNPLLSALEERILVFTGAARGERYVRAHPEFRAIFTSNPEDYAGVQAPQDALVDRMITFDLTEHELQTEAGIVARRSGLGPEGALPIVRLVRAIRAEPSVGAQPPSMRSAIMIARIVASEGLVPSAADERFVQLCFDVLESRAPRADRVEARRAYFEALRLVILRACPPAGLRASAEKAA